MPFSGLVMHRVFGLNHGLFSSTTRMVWCHGEGVDSSYHEARKVVCLYTHVVHAQGDAPPLLSGFLALSMIKNERWMTK